jgi:hypothetical protein
MRGLIVDVIPNGPVTYKAVQNMLPMNRNFTVIWGSNVAQKTYQNKNISFSGGAVNWQGGASVNLRELARVALVTKDARMWGVIRGLNGGDQVSFAGTLMNARGTRIVPVDYCTNHLDWDTGSLDDNGRFWTLYVKEVRVLKKANVFFKYLFWVSLCGILGTVIVRFSNLFPYGT